MLNSDLELNPKVFDKEVVSWLTENSIPLSTTKQEDLTDLEPIRDIIGNAQLVGLGEATHGSREFIEIRGSIFKFLVKELGFKGLVMEVPEEPARKINDYIHTGEGELNELLKGLGYWTVRNQEMAEMFEWMKNYNKTNPDSPISFYGCDILVDDGRRNQSNSVRDKALATNCLRFLDDLGDDGKLVLWGHNAHVANLDIPNFKTLGSHLKERLAQGYVNFTTLFNRGSFLAIQGNTKADNVGEIEAFTLSEDQEQSYSALFRKTGIPIAITDLRQTQNNPIFQSWRNGEHTVREVGSMFDHQQEATYSQSIDLPNKFDVVVYIDKVTPATLIDN